MSISVQNITKIYSRQKALDKISLEVKPGEIVGLLGPNGAGKSTLMKILTCFIPPTSGDASVCGFDILEQSMEVRKKVGYLPENNPLYLDLYVREFLNFCAGTHRIKSNIDGRIAEMIELTGLETEQHKRIGSLSKGYRQRVGLAQALLHDPEVLILDEPTSGLDPILLEIRNLIREIGKKKTVMISTLSCRKLKAICNRVIIIHKGHIVADDTTQNLQHLSASRPVIRVEFSSPVASELILAIPGVLKASPMLLVRSGAKDQVGASPAWMLAPEADRDIRANVFQFAVDHQLTVLSLHQEEQRLEEVFQELTRN